MGVKHHVKKHDPIATQTQPKQIKTRQKYSKVVFFGIKKPLAQSKRALAAHKAIAIKII